MEVCLQKKKNLKVSWGGGIAGGPHLTKVKKREKVEITSTPSGTNKENTLYLPSMVEFNLRLNRKKRVEGVFIR